MAKEKVITFNEKEVAVLEALKNSDKALTLAEISDLVGFKVASGTVVSLIKKGAAAKGEPVTVAYTATKEVGSYKIAS